MVSSEGANEGLSRGAAFRHVLKNLLLKDGRPVFQSIGSFYDECHSVEQRIRRVDEPVCFGLVSEDHYKRKKIRDIQNKEDRISIRELHVIAGACGLPEDFFLKGYETIEGLERSFHEQRGVTAPTPSPHIKDLAEGFRVVSKSEPLPSCRQEMIAPLHQKIIALPEGVGVTLVEGRTWVGKSFFVAYWFWNHGRTFFDRGAICIDCSSITVNQIVSDVERYFSSIPPCDRGLVVLEGLSVDWYGGTPFLPGLKVKKNTSIGEFLEELRSLLDQEKFHFILCVENNSNELDESLFAVLPAFNRVFVGPLTDEQGAEFLAVLGAGAISESDRLLLSRRLQGLPPSLRAAAAELSHLSFVEQERYLNASLGALSPTGSPREDSGAFFRAWLARKDLEPGSDPHPHALLRLLALMPGAISRVHLDAILTEKKIARLKNLTAEAAFRIKLPFVVIIDDKIDLHSMVRSYLRSELEDCIQVDDYAGSFTSRNELEWLHWKCAQINWHILRGEAEADIQIVQTIEAFVYHVMSQIKLIPLGGARRRFNTSVSLRDAVVTKFEAEESLLSNTQLWDLAYHKVVSQFLLDSGHVATRVYGQYEAKARILAELIKTAGDSQIKIHAKIAINLYKEMTLCWMHAGRLNLSTESHGFAFSAFMKTSPKALINVSESSSGHDKEDWHTRCFLASISVALRMRSGRTFSQCSSEIDGFMTTAKRIAAAAQPNSEKYTPPLERGALRIITRQGDLTLASGDVESSIGHFEMASALFGNMYGRSLDGEASRRFAIALVLSRATDPARLGRAEDLVDENIRYLAKGATDLLRGRSNDLLPFRTLRVGLHRVKGDYDAAAAALEEIKQHELFRRGETTFLSAAEVDFEEIRLQLACRGINEESYEKALRLAQRMSNSHHYLLGYDALVLAAEASSGETRRLLLEKTRGDLRLIAMRLRLQDIDELERGGSAVKRFGF